MSADPKAEKKALRQHFKALRDALPEADRTAWSEEVCRRITAFAVSRKIRRVGAFWPFGSELDLRPLVAAHPDWTFFFPRIASSSPPRLIWGPEPLEPGLWGLMEPAHAQHFTPPVQLLLVPGLAFDERGFRLGYGKGFYDALIDHLDEEVITLAVGFEAQRTLALPQSPLDQPVQALATEAGLTRFA